MLKPSPEGEGFNPTQTWDNKSFLLLVFDQIKGKFEKLKLRCSRKFKELKFVADAEYKIPEKWGVCQLQIIGDKGSEGRIIQY